MATPQEFPESGLEMIHESKEIVLDTLRSFREFSDLCREKEVFAETAKSIEKISQDFRNMAAATVKAATFVSDLYLDTTIVFFENIDSFNDPFPMLDRLSREARELSQCFKLFSKWAKNMSAKFHQAQHRSIKAIHRYQLVHEAALESADRYKREVERECNDAKRSREISQKSGEEYLEKYESSSMWNPLKYVYAIGFKIKESHTRDMLVLEKLKEIKLEEAETSLEETTSESEEAEKVADEATAIMQLLSNVEKISEGIAAYWELQANNYDTQAVKMSDKMMFTALKKIRTEENIKFWKKTRSDIQRYTDAMHVIISSQNFNTENLQFEPTRDVNFPNIQLTLKIPASIASML